MGTPPSPSPGRPRGYPQAYESVARLADGRTVDVRPIVPDDAPALAQAFREADDETLRLRFLGGPPRLTDALLTRLTCVDYERRFALVAEKDGQGVAIARYDALPAAADGTVTADVAITVAPEWRDVGLATTLLEQLARRAQECGITHLSALFSATNWRVADLARAANATVVIDNGSAELDVALDGPHDDWPHLTGAEADAL